MKCAEGDRKELIVHPGKETVPHLPGCRFCECDDSNVGRICMMDFDQIPYPFDRCKGLTGTRTGKDQCRSGIVGNRPLLLFVFLQKILLFMPAPKVRFPCGFWTKIPLCQGFP